VADIGCGTGTFLKIFKSNGVTDVIGVDGSWVDRKLLQNNIDEADFYECDFEKGFILQKRYDISICLEVAEHISPEKASGFINDLCKTSDIIIFSAAIPFQGGQNHLNEQWIDYWQSLFKVNKYSIYDGLRQIIWDYNNVEVWYKNNIFIFIKNSIPFDNPNYSTVIRYEKIKMFIHPDLFELYSKGYHDVFNGRMKPIIYLKLFIKSLFKLIGKNV
jgi:SAM-dependent methyltransferase